MASVTGTAAVTCVAEPGAGTVTLAVGTSNRTWAVPGGSKPLPVTVSFSSSGLYAGSSDVRTGSIRLSQGVTVKVSRLLTRAPRARVTATSGPLARSVGSTIVR